MNANQIHQPKWNFGSSIFNLCKLELFFYICFVFSSNSILLATAENPYDNEDIYNQINSWEASEAMRRNFTYYLSGHDYSGRPVWIAEFGKWNIKDLVEKGTPTIINEFDHYLEQYLYRIHMSPKKFSVKQDQVHEIDPTEELEISNDNWVLILDMDGYTVDQILSVKALEYALRFATKLEIAAQNMEYGFFINSNYFVDQLINLLKPVMGSTLAKLEGYGTQRKAWIPKLLRDIPRDQLPELYGGTKDFRPVAVFG